MKKYILTSLFVACLLGAGMAVAASPPSVDITLKTPAVQAIQDRMTKRFQSTLKSGFDSGALGFTSDGMVALRDPSKVELKQRVLLASSVADDNRDRKALYREVAVANGRAEWESPIRAVFAQQWIESAKEGWWYHVNGDWKQK